MLHEAIDILENRFKAISRFKSSLNNRQKKIIQFIERNEPVRMTDISQSLNEETIHNFRKELAYLKNENLIRQVGNGKATIYYLKTSLMHGQQ